MRLLKLSFFAIAGLFSIASSAYDFKVNGLCYNKNRDGSSVSVTFETYDDVNPTYPNLTGALTIPASVTYNQKTYSVTKVGSGAFFMCSGITNVTIPNTVTDIDLEAFYHCTGLKSVTMGNSIINIGNAAFYYCTGLTSVTTGNTVNAIGDYAFSECTGLKSVTIGRYVYSIGTGAFKGCTSLIRLQSQIRDLTNLRIGNNVFDSVDKSLCILYVPSSALNSYAKQSPWKEFLNIKPDTYTLKITSITVSPTSITITQSDTKTLTTDILPSNATNQKLSWETSDTNVATVDQYGDVKAVATGNATITATTTDGTNLSASCEVTVTGITALELNKTATSIYVGGTDSLAVTITPDDVINKTIVWQSSDTTVAAVEQDGVVTAVAPGNATITATTTDGTNLSASCEVTVTGITTLELNKAATSIYVGGSDSLAVTITPDDVINKTIVWQSSDTTVAAVEQDGVVTAVAPGNATITATTTDGTNLSASCEVTVFVLLPGDVNGDEVVNVIDYVSTASYILEQNPQPFIFSAADLDNNGTITVGDLVGVAALALTFESSPNLALAHHNDNKTVGLVMSTDVTAVSGNRYEVAINLKNNKDITAMQLDLHLPCGIKMTDFTLSNRATKSHDIAQSELTDGSYRLLIVSGTCKTFTGNEGVILTLTLEGHSDDYAILSGINVATPDATGYHLDDISLDFSSSGIDKVSSDCRIIAEGEHIVIDSPIATTAQFVQPSGQYTTVKVRPGHNVFVAPATGIVIVKMDKKAIKLKF